MLAQTILTIVTAQAHAVPVSIRDACLRGAAVPEHSNLNQIDLTNSDISGGDLYKAQLREANLRFANLSGTNLAGADFYHAGMYCTIGENARSLTVASIMSPDSVPFNVSGATFDNSLINRSVLPRSNFSGTHFDNGEIKDTCLNGADLYEAHFTNVHIRKTIFDGINGAGAVFKSPLFDVSFDGANLDGAKFGGSTLERVSFRGAYLKDANFEGATIAQTRFDGALLCHTTMPDGRVEPGTCPLNFDREKALLANSCTVALKSYCSSASETPAKNKATSDSKGK